MFANCSECGKSIAISDVKYHTPPVNGQIHHAFCDAYCSFEWYSKNAKEDKRNDRRTDG